MNRDAVIEQNATIKEALKLIDKLAGNTLIIVNDLNQAIGTVTDGDIRRGLINDLSLNKKVIEVMSKDFKFLTENDFTPEKIKELKDINIMFVPLLSKNREIVDILNLKKLKSFLPLEAVIMAGGKGSRLAPLTLETPKPLLKIGGKPIIEYNIDRLISYGISKIYISVNYLKEQIKDYFGDGSSKGIEIYYIEEDTITGTLGSATYVKDYATKDILVMNSDLLTNINFEDFYQNFIEQKAEMAVASVPYEVNIPYGVVETDENRIVSLKEKPTYTFYSNAGIYILKVKCLDEIPQRGFYNATDLIEKLIQEKRAVVNFPIVDYWLDIGKPKDFEKAQQDIKHIQL